MIISQIIARAIADQQLLELIKERKPNHLAK